MFWLTICFTSRSPHEETSEFSAVVRDSPASAVLIQGCLRSLWEAFAEVTGRSPEGNRRITGILCSSCAYPVLILCSSCARPVLVLCSSITSIVFIRERLRRSPQAAHGTR